VLKGITHETRATLESMCYGSLCSLNVDDMSDLFEYPCGDQFRDACDHYSSCLMHVLIVNLLTMM